MIEIKGPDGATYKFPKGTSQEVMRGAMAKVYGAPASPAAPAEISVPIEGLGATPPAPATPQAAPPSPMQNIANLARQGQRALLEGATLGASDEILAGMDTLAGKGSVASNLERRAAETQAIPSQLRIPAEAAGAMATGGLAGPIRGLLARSVGPGAVYGYNASEGTPLERLPGAAIGAATAGAADVALSGLSRVISPLVRRQVQRLQGLGVEPTPGQILGGGARSFEERAKSMPILGPAITAGETRAMRQFNVGAVNEALAPAGIKIPSNVEPGRELVNAATDAIGDAYRRAIPGGTRVVYTPAMRTEMQAVSQNAADLLDDTGMSVVQRQINRITQPGSSGGAGMTGTRAQEVLSDLRKAGRRYSGSSTAAEQNVGDVLGQIEDVFQRQLEQAVPDPQALRNANRAYAQWKRVERAASTLGAEEGMFSPAQLQNAVRAMDRSVDKRAFAQGRALGQDVSEAGKSVLGNRVPDSGTAPRSLQAAGLMGGGAGLAIDPVTTLAAAGGGLGLPSLAYTPFVQRLMGSIMTGRQSPGYQATAETVRRLGAPVGLGLVSGTQR